jgi:hypothetical protein
MGRQKSIGGISLGNWVLISVWLGFMNDTNEIRPVALGPSDRVGGAWVAAYCIRVELKSPRVPDRIGR